MKANQDQVIKKISNNLSEIRYNIKKAAEKVGENATGIKLVGVTKNRSPELIDLAILAGLKSIGENRVQEAEAKIPQLTQEYHEFHFIGHLQKNKINKLIPHNPILIHSIDSAKTAAKLNRYHQDTDTGKKIAILVQVNCSEEESKDGIPNNFEALKSFIDDLNRLINIKLKGLMTIAPLTADNNKIRASFATLKKYFDRINDQNIYSSKLDTISMGMSNDYQIAIEEGANLVRIGSAIFRDIPEINY